MTIHAPLAPPDAESGYDADFYLWTIAQAQAIRAARPDGIDWENVAEEIESLGNALVRELSSRLTVIIEHLLKLQYGMNRDPVRGWEETIIEQRFQLDGLLRQNPSLKRKIDEELPWCFRQGRKKALAGFKRYEAMRYDEYSRILPADLLYTVAQLLDEEYFPAPENG